MTKPESHSISVRLRRTIIQEAYVSVPISNEIMDLTPDEEGNFSIDQHAVIMQAVLMGLDDDTQWTIEEEARVEPRPEQIAPPTVC